jgi:hypothetical protein
LARLSRASSRRTVVRICRGVSIQHQYVKQAKLLARDNFIAFECPKGDPNSWCDIVDGLPDPLIQNGIIEVWTGRAWERG